MDAFLRRVVELRDYQQELALIETPVEVLIPGPCRVCGGFINMVEASVQLTVCSKRGGRKKQARLEREDAVLVRRQEFRSPLLRLAYPNQEVVMARECVKCGKKLHWKTQGNECPTGCKTAEAPPVPLKARRTKDTRKRFRVLTEALGIDGEKLLEEFMQGWIERIRSSVPRPEDDDGRQLQAVND